MNVKLYTVYDQSPDSRIFLNKPRKISALCSFGNLLFLGTFDGYLLQVIYDEIDEEKTCFSFGVIFERHISESGIALLQASRYAEFVGALSNNKLRFFDAEKLEYSTLRSTLDAISTFSIRDSDVSSERHSILAVCTVNLHLQVYRVVKTRMDLVNTVILPCSALNVCCLEGFAIAASNKKYIGIDLKTKISHDIFDRTGCLERPLIDFFSTDEFLLSGPGSLGIFVNNVGQSNRPPLALSTNLLALFSRDQLVFAVDDEFLTIHNPSQQKQVQTMVVQNVCAACISLDRPIIFLATHDPVTNAPQIRVVQPETWDMEAKRLILAGCLSDASALVDDQFTQLIDLCNQRPATSGFAKKIFSARSKRVCTLMGLYLFENGQLVQAREFFEKSSLDIRELLSRYVDLLPRGYGFTPDPALHITASSKAVPDATSTEGQPPCNIFNLAECVGVSVIEFRKFLLNFLLENRRGRIFAQYTQFVETAILKLCVQLSEEGSLMPYEGYENWDGLVESLSSVDIDDLLLFLDEHRAHHVKALLCRWNCDVEGALEIWKSLALGVLIDENFPGPKYYIDALFTSQMNPHHQVESQVLLLLKPGMNERGVKLCLTGAPTMAPTIIPFSVARLMDRKDRALTSPTAFREHISVASEAGSTTFITTGCTTYAELVARHLEGFLATAESLPLADALIRHLACITSWSDAGSTIPISSAGKFVLAPDALLERLRTQHPNLAENYLWLKIFKAGDKEPSHHTLLAELQLQLLLKYAGAKDDERLAKQRLRFRYTLSHLEDCQTEKLLETLRASSLAALFTEEYVTLLGKLKKYDEALEVLVLKQQNLELALRFCAWCTDLEARQRLTEQSVLWNHQETNCNTKTSLKTAPKSEVYTALLKLLITSNDLSLLEQSKKLMEKDIPLLDFVEVLKVLPEKWQIDPAISAFLTHALKTMMTRVSKSNIELGLTTRMASASRAEATVSIAQGLRVTEASKCARCHLPLNAYGDQRPFAWIVNQECSPSTVMHLHCLHSNITL